MANKHENDQLTGVAVFKRKSNGKWSMRHRLTKPDGGHRWIAFGYSKKEEVLSRIAQALDRIEREENK